jgi:hypothetical protein
MNTYAFFADELRRAQSGEVSLLDEETGLIARWSEICEERYGTPPAAIESMFLISLAHGLLVKGQCARETRLTNR